MGGWVAIVICACRSRSNCGINLLDSKDVSIEGNTFKGFEQNVRVNGDSTYILK